MKKAIMLAIGCSLACGICVAAAQVEKTMTVARCQAVGKDGRQCTQRVEDGKTYCWRHQSQKNLNEMADDTARGASETWQATKTWSTNAWEKTCSGAMSAVQATEDAAKSLRKDFIEMFGEKNASKKKSDKEGK